MFAETWNSADTVFCVPDGYDFVQSVRQKNPRARRNSGGLLFCYRTELQDGIKVVKNTHRDILWVRLDKTHFGLDTHLFICLIYISCPDTNIADFFNDLTDDILTFQTRGQVILSGDFNGRTQSESGIYVPNNVHLEDDGVIIDDSPIDINEFVNNNFAYTISRVSCDKVRPDITGQNILDMCIGCNLLLMNGRSYDDKGTGKYTCHQPGGKSVVDYLIIDYNCLVLVSGFSISDELPFCDHSILQYSFRTKAKNTARMPNNGNNNENDPNMDCSSCHKFKWKPELENEFKCYMQSNNFTDQLDCILENLVGTSITRNVINGSVDRFSECLQNALSDIHGVVNNNRTPSNYTSSGHTWFNNDCRKARNKFSQACHKHKRYPSDVNKLAVNEAKQEYRNTIDLAKSQCDNKCLNELLEYSNKGNHRKFWAKFKAENKNNTNELPNFNDLYRHFESLSTSDNYYPIGDVIIDDSPHILDLTGGGRESH